MTTSTNEQICVKKLPRPFILRRFHSLFGIWLVLYLCQHLLINSQTALFLQDDGVGFVSMVNKIHGIPYLRLVEALILGLPFLVHGIWGIKYALTSKTNSLKTNGATPSLPQFRRNRAFTWQRVTSWLLLFGIAAHVVHMRFLEYPAKSMHGESSQYMVSLKADHGLPLVAEKLGASLYTAQDIQEKKIPENITLPDERDEWLKAAQSKPLKEGKVLAVSPNAGGAFFLIVREAFKNPLIVILYSILVVAAVYHAFNGLWTAFITWGINLTARSQKLFRMVTTFLMGVVMFLGLMSAWGTYWTYLFQR